MLICVKINKWLLVIKIVIIVIVILAITEIVLFESVQCPSNDGRSLSGIMGGALSDFYAACTTYARTFVHGDYFYTEHRKILCLDSEECKNIEKVYQMRRGRQKMYFVDKDIST